MTTITLCKFLLVVVITISLTNLSLGQQIIWQQVLPPDSGTFSSLVCNSDGHIFAGTGFQGIYRSTDNGFNWVRSDSGLTYKGIGALAINHKGHILAGTRGGGIFRSLDDGNNWLEINAGLDTFYNDILSIAISPAGYLYAGTCGKSIYISTNNGNKWEVINSGNIAPCVPSIAIDPNGHYYAGSYWGGIYHTTFPFGNWKYSGLGYLTVSSIVVNENGDVFAATLGGNVYRSTNNGIDWIQINNGLITTNVNSLIINSSGYIFAGTQDGVFYSSNYGDSWISLGTGFPDYCYIGPIAINSNGYIFAGSSYSGLFRSSVPVTDIKNSNGSFPKYIRLEQNYPNPFNPKTTISYQLPTQSQVTLKVYNVLGIEVATLVNELKQPGSESVSFDAIGLPSGVYYYHLQVGIYSETKKLILIK